MPKVGDKVTSPITIQGDVVIITLSGEISSVKADDVDIELVLNDGNKHKISTKSDKLKKGAAPGKWEFPLQVKT